MPKAIDNRYDRFIPETIESYPRGYPLLAAYINSDIDGRLYRRFGYLRNRVLLHRQDELCVLESRLAEVDQRDSRGEALQSYRLLSRRYDEEDLANCERKKIIDELDMKLKGYDKLLLREHKIMSIRQPSRKIHRGYLDYIWNDKPICKEEYEFIYRQDDFVALRTQEDGWLGSYTEALARLLPRKLLKFLLASKADNDRSNHDAGVQFYSNERTETVVKAIIGTAATILLVVPIVVLYVLSAHGASGGLRIGVLLILVVAFALSLATLTRASRHEMFTASAT